MLHPSRFQSNSSSIAAPQSDWLHRIALIFTSFIAESMFQIDNNMGRNPLVDAIYVMYSRAPPVRRVLQKSRSCVAFNAEGLAEVKVPGQYSHIQPKFIRNRCKSSQISVCCFKSRGQPGACRWHNTERRNERSIILFLTLQSQSLGLIGWLRIVPCRGAYFIDGDPNVNEHKTNRRATQR